jgi:hypothetical protein
MGQNHISLGGDPNGPSPGYNSYAYYNDKSTTDSYNSSSSTEVDPYAVAGNPDGVTFPSKERILADQLKSWSLPKVGDQVMPPLTGFWSNAYSLLTGSRSFNYSGFSFDVGNNGKILGPTPNEFDFGANPVSWFLGGPVGEIKGIALARKLGQAGEDAVGIVGPKSAINVAGRTRFPDALTRTTLIEVKNVKALNLTSQLRDYISFAQQTARDVTLYTRPNTILSGPLKDAIKKGLIIRRDIPFKL